MRVRLKDIADRLGLDKGTVSRVLRDDPRAQTFRPATRELILHTAQEMHYAPNLAARALTGKGSMKLGVLIDSHAPRYRYRILWAIEGLAEQSGYGLMIGQAHNSPLKLYENYEKFMQHGIDGVICLAHDYPGKEGEMRGLFGDKSNIVFYDPPGWDAPHVLIDRESGITQAIRHVQSQGRKRVCLWLPHSPTCFSLNQRVAAFRRAYGDAGCMAFESLDEVVRRILDNHIDAVLAVNDLHAASLAQRLIKEGISIPEEVALIGHDDDDYAALYSPSLSTIALDGELVGRTLFDLLKRKICGETIQENPVIGTQLIVRESS